MQLFNRVSLKCSKITTTSYSTSFSLGIKLLDKKFHDPIYAIYGFVRFADEIVDTFHEYNKSVLLERFKEDTYKAIEDGISLNPILNSFQWAVNKYKIDRELIDAFLHSMEMDLYKKFHDQSSYEEYILGSAEVVGLMCLQVFCEGDKKMYESLKYQAMKLGSAFQKINFLRDLQADYKQLGRTYFPGVDMTQFNDMVKKEIEADIEKDFAIGLEGIMNLPIGAKLGVYVAYVYYYNLFNKIKNIPASELMKNRARIPNLKKIGLLFSSYFRLRFNML
jgi:phytoene/squalene synthetase